MSADSLRDDEAIQHTDADRLGFAQHVQILEELVLQRDPERQAPFVTGIFSPWGSGKTSLMNLLMQKLEEREAAKKEAFEKRLGDPVERKIMKVMEIQYEPDWIPIQFSPWVYRGETNLIAPLLAAIAQKDRRYKQALGWLLRRGSLLTKILIGMGLKQAQTILPLTEFLATVQTNIQNARSLRERIQQSLNAVLREKTRLVFFIDDLDRCHDHEQIISLLEQIRLFLDFERCVFFIGADREQIRVAIEKKFEGEGENYLDKFFQLSYELPAHREEDLIAMLGAEDKKQNEYLRRVAWVLDYNPRRLKKIYNRLTASLEIIRGELKSAVPPSSRKPDPRLMLKAILLEDAPRFTPELYLSYEKKARECKDREERNRLREEFYKEFETDPKPGPSDAGGENERARDASRDYRDRLKRFLWRDMETNAFRENQVLRLYLKRRLPGTKRLIEEELEKLLEQGTREINERDLSGIKLRGENLQGITFTDCKCKTADFADALLDETRFIRCDLDNAIFDGASLQNTSFENCENLDTLNTGPILYEQIAERAWEFRLKDRPSGPASSRDQREKEEQYFKMYRAIIERHKERGTLTPEIEKRLREKGRAVRRIVLGDG